jgi:uncharacterized protein (DUF1800 family)
MDRKTPRLTLRAAVLSALFLASVSLTFAQRGGDENFESPTPVLLTESSSDRALVQPAGASSDIRSLNGRSAFKPGSRIELFVSDLTLLPGEGANSLRIYADDGRGHLYRFPVTALRQVGRNIWAVSVTLRDEIGYYAPPAANGDVLVYLTWRGLASNKVRLGLGRVGGDLKEPGTKFDAPLSLPVAREADRLRFQEQAAFGPTPALSAQLVRTKFSTWIQSQFNAAYPSFPYPAQPLKPVNPEADCDGDQITTPDVPPTCFRDTYGMYPIQTWNGQEMLYEPNQLRHKVAWALSQIWVTSGVDIQQSRHMVEYHKILSNNAFGNYRTLMRQMTLSPTMGQYLSMALSTRNNPNENYAREIMQLFTVGLYMLNQDGTLQLDAGGDPIPTYDQTNVNNLTKVLTGWNLCTTGCPNSVPGSPNYIDPMVLNLGVTTLNGNRHDLTAKTLLSYPGSTTTNIPACPVLPAAGACNATPTATGLANTQTYAYASLDQALDNIFYHPNLGPYVSKILIQQMVESDPTPAYVGRVAAAFNNNGVGVRGDMKAVISAILLDPEARGNVKTDPNYGKLREPVSYAMNFLRAFNARSADGTTQSDGVINARSEFNGMGQNPFRSPTVFNYYPPSFIIPGTAMLGPEFALMTTGTTIQRANFINRMVGYNSGNGNAFTGAPIPVALPNVPLGTSLDVSDLIALSAADATGGQLVDELNRRLLHGTMSASMRSTLLTAITSVTATDGAGRVRMAIYLVATSSQYQVQR